MKDFPYFKASELACKCGQCDGGDMDEDFMESIITMRIALKFPFVVTSAYRCPEHNSRVSRTGRTGPHTTGHAIDIKAYGHRASQLIEAAYHYKVLSRLRGGLGVHQTGPWHKRFIHLDDLTHSHSSPRPRVWSY